MSNEPVRIDFSKIKFPPLTAEPLEPSPQPRPIRDMQRRIPSSAPVFWSTEAMCGAEDLECPQCRKRQMSPNFWMWSGHPSENDVPYCPDDCNNCGFSYHEYLDQWLHEQAYSERLLKYTFWPMVVLNVCIITVFVQSTGWVNIGLGAITWFIFCLPVWLDKGKFIDVQCEVTYRQWNSRQHFRWAGNVILLVAYLFLFSVPRALIESIVN